MTTQRRRSKSQLFNRRRREARLVPAPQSSGLDMQMFQSLVHDRDNDQASRPSKEPLTDEREDEIDNELRKHIITIALTPEVLEAAGIDDPQNLTARDARSYYKDLLAAVLVAHPELLDTDVAHYTANTERPPQGGMSITYFLRRADAPPSKDAASHDAATLYTTNRSGQVSGSAESDAVLRCQWIPRRNEKTRLLTIREIAVLEAQGKLRAARMVKFTGLPALRDMECALLTTTRAHGEPLSNLLQLQFERKERKRPDLSMKDMYALMQAMRQWVQLLRAMDDRGCEHRDIKPEHLFVNFDDPTHSDIIDWGLSKSKKTARNRTPANETLGTIQYFSPGAAHGLPDPNRDIFALGISMGEALRLFFYRSTFTYDEALIAAAVGATHDVPELTAEHVHDELRDWSPYPPERQLAYILSLMIRPTGTNGSFNGAYDKLLAMIDAILVDQRLWVEATEATQSMSDLLKATNVQEEDRDALVTLHTRLEQELYHGTAETMRATLSEYRSLITTIQQSDPHTTAA